MRSLLPLAAFALACAASCASPNFDEPAPLPSEADQTPRDAGKGATVKPPPSSSGSRPAPPPAPSGSTNGGVDPGPQARRWKGSLAATLPVEFGGGQNCKYRITLQQVTVDVTAAGNGDIVAANVTAVAFEEVLTTSCSNTPIPPHTHTYALTLASVLSGGVSHLELAGPATNNPAASLIIQGDFRTANPELSLQWHRTDYGPPLDWRVSANITTAPQ